MRRICTAGLLVSVLGLQAQERGAASRADLKTLSIDGQDRQKAGDYAGASERFQHCADSAVTTSNVYWASVCLQLQGGVERLQGKYAEAEAHYKQSLEYAAQPEAAERLPLILNNLASVYGAQSRYSDALPLLKQVIEYNTGHGIENDASPFQNLAIIYSLQGDLARGLEYFNRALHIYEASGEVRKTALSHFNIGALQLRQANYVAAAYEMDTAFALAEKTGDQTIVAQTLSEIGRIRDLQGNTREALDALNRAERLTIQMGSPALHAAVLLNLGDLHANHGDYERASREFEEAGKISSELHDSDNLGIALRGLSYVAQRRMRFTDANRYASEAVAEARRVGTAPAEWQARVLLGMAWRGLHDLAKAREEFSLATELIEAQRGLLGGGDVEKQRFFEHAVFPYHQLASIELDLDDPRAALQAAERARARVLVDIAESGPQRIERYMTEPERAEETRLRAQIASAKPGVAKDRLFQSYEAFIASVYVKHPELRSLRGESPVVRDAELANMVPDARTVIVEYLCGVDETLIFAITRQGTRALRIPVGREALARQTEAYRTAVEGRDPGFRAAGTALYKTLLLPIAAQLAGKNRVYLVPDGPLWSLPFQTLPRGPSRYWIEDAVISYAPSITFLRDRMKAAAPREHRVELMAFGVSELSLQARRIAALYPSTKVDLNVGSAASERAFVRGAPHARVIHVAAHGVVDGITGLHSRILLTPGSPGDDGSVEAWELMRMDLNADLIVLSACETGRGRASDGEGLVGLTWALFVAGARSAVVSQWRVEAESTTELMVALHRGLRRGLAPAAALREAALQVMKLEKYRHPMYWGAFVAAGL